MKNFFLLAITLSFLPLASFGNSLQKDIRRLMELADGGSNGGGTYLLSYDVRKFDYQKQVREVLTKIRDSECGYSPVIGRRALVQQASAFAAFSSSKEAVALIRKLERQGQIKAAVGFLWSDTGRGESEYCLKEEIEIFFIDGSRLFIDFDSTT